VTQTRVLVLRHGQSEGNVARVWTSSLDGYPLTGLGREQARAAGERLLGRGVTALYASPLPRAQQTAGLVGEVLGLAVATLPGVHELDVGVHEGEHDDTVGPVAIEVFGRWWRDEDLTAGFPGGETGLQIVDRMRAALDSVADRHEGETSVVVSHGGAMALGLQSLCDNLDTVFVSQHILANCELVELRRDADGWHCETWAGLARD
jgi:broad specificity phosphatase PhoE